MAGSLALGMGAGLAALLVTTAQPGTGAAPTRFAAQPAVNAPAAASTTPTAQPARGGGGD